jgi:hypothetical protein
MREFFHGWRRKVGVLTLVMALAFAGAWLRGHRVKDVYSTRGPRTVCDTWSSSHEGIAWLRLRLQLPITISTPGWRTYTVGTTGKSVEGFFRNQKQAVDWRWKWLGFDFGQSQASQPIPLQMTFLTIPYWSLVLPPTLLSAYLILWKPRKRTSDA